ncbi:helix-turn-helix domain-containing protein [Streptomyces sp. NPDC057217]|uniref:helix-turn-helix domain-containing protein n=1 Tax=Streptomyces sp. NPDC057217 TaxID=3346054 RepID=UPI00362B565B
MSETINASPFMKTAELARLLGKTPNAVLIMRHRGQAPRGFRSGKDVLFRRTAVDAWLRAKEAEDRLGQRAAA